MLGEDVNSCFKYPQDVHTREAKIYSPEAKIKHNLIILQKTHMVMITLTIHQNTIFTLVCDLFEDGERFFKTPTNGLQLSRQGFGQNDSPKHPRLLCLYDVEKHEDCVEEVVSALQQKSF